MKSIIRKEYFLSFALLTSTLSNAQQVRNSLKQPVNMKTIEAQKNKESIRKLYEVILNKRELGQLNELISGSYSNEQGEKGVEGFKKGITAILNAFPDAQWTIEELIAEDNKVIIKQKVEGTHNGVFQNIPATGKQIRNYGFAVYTFDGGEIMHHQIQTDRLAFLQQLEVLPAELPVQTHRSEENVFFVDKFKVPRSASAEFIQRMEYNRAYIKKLPGFIMDEVMILEDTATDGLTIMTVACWQNEEYMKRAKELVQAEYKKINFNPVEFCERLNISMEREVYKAAR